VLVAAALAIGMLGVGASGAQWADAPQYANAGAMFRDWLRSGQLLHPYAFAQANYAQYPAFSVPFHPPGYPALLGLFFLLAGLSYESARLFVALLLGVAGCCFFLILRRASAVPRVPALGCALLLLTMPEVARWSRDTMSEIPALAFVLVGSYAFVRWLETSRQRDSVLAFGFAGAAFLSKITVAGVLPAWIAWIGVRGARRRLFAPSLLVPGALFLAASAAWVWFFVPFARYETAIGISPADLEAARAAGLAQLQAADLRMYFRALPSMTGCGALVAGASGLGAALARGGRWRDATMWLAWLVAYAGLLLLLGLHYEARYFTFALVAVPGLAALLFSPRVPDPVADGVAHRVPHRVLTSVGYGVVAVALTENAWRIGRLPAGVVGYDRVAQRIAALEQRGNVLVGVPFQNDLTFRYRAQSPRIARSIIRADRSVALRLPNYAPVANQLQMVVSGSESFVELVRRGRVRYVVALSEFTRAPGRPHVEDEMSVTTRAVRSRPDAFAPVDSFWIQFGARFRVPGAWVQLWEYRHPLPDGPSEIPVVVPTARLTITPDR
jgi:4-amino-4-deoxy-L-arabinose transferase-like glycosyltransferase